LRLVFRSRMNEPFAVRDFVARHSERKIRITDMIGRRGRSVILGFAGFSYVYRRLSASPDPGFLTLGLQDGLFEAVVFSGAALALCSSVGGLARMFSAAKSRVMAGHPARPNCFLIPWLWSLFRFVMVPIGIQLAVRFPPATFATVYILIWGSYLASDAFS